MDYQPSYHVTHDPLFPGCPSCGHGKLWIIVGPSGAASYRLYADRYEAEQDCKDINQAFGLGRANQERFVRPPRPERKPWRERTERARR